MVRRETYGLFFSGGYSGHSVGLCTRRCELTCPPTAYQIELRATPLCAKHPPEPTLSVLAVIERVIHRLEPIDDVNDIPVGRPGRIVAITRWTDWEVEVCG